MGGAEIQPWSEGAALGVLLAKISLLLLLGWAAHYVLRQSHPRWRVLLWRGVIGGIVLIPLIFLAGPRWQMEVSPIAPVLIMPPAFEMEPAALEPGMNPPIEIPSPSTTDPAPSLLSSSSQSSVSMPQANWNPASWIKQNAWLALLAGWVLGVAFFAARLGRASVWVSRIVRTSQPATETAKRMVARVVEDLGARRDVTLRFSPHVPSPFLCGVLRPVIVLPARMRDLDYRDRLPGILAHEIAHLRSHDLPWYATIHGLRVILWFHPLTWRIWSAHAAACEEVSDSVAAAYVGNQETYSKTLASVALEIIARPAGAGGIPMTRTSEIRKRLESLRERWSGRPLSRRRVGAVGFAALLALAALAGMEPVRGSIAGAEDESEALEITGAYQGTMIRQVLRNDSNIDQDSCRLASISPDGVHILLHDNVGWKFVDIEKERLAYKKLPDFFNTIDKYPISPDSEKIAYIDYDAKSPGWSVFVYNVKTGRTQFVKGNEKSECAVFAWSKDCKRILGWWEDKTEDDLANNIWHSHQLAWFSAENGELDIVKEYSGGNSDWEMPWPAFPSPDESLFAASVTHLIETDPKQGKDIRLLSKDGKSEVVLVPSQPKVETELMGWSADGRWVLYTSNQTGTWDLWGIRILNGKPRTVPELILGDIGNINMNGIDPQNRLYFTSHDEQSNLYLCHFNDRMGIFNQYPIGKFNMMDFSWSRDGKKIAYVSSLTHTQKGSYSSHDRPLNYLEIYSPDDKSETIQTIQSLRLLGNFSPDNKSIIAMFTHDFYNLHSMNLSTKESVPILANALINNVIYSGDGKSLYYMEQEIVAPNTSGCTRIKQKDIQANSITEIYQAPPKSYLENLAISPDGKWLDFCCGEYPSVQIMCIPAAGGEPIVVHNYRQDESLIKLAGWLPDSKAILFTVSTPNRGLTNYDVTGLFKVSIEDKKVEKIWKPDKKGILKLNVSPDGEYAAYIQTQSRYEGLWVLENFLPREVARAGTQ